MAERDVMQTEEEPQAMIDVGEERELHGEPQESFPELPLPISSMGIEIEAYSDKCQGDRDYMEDVVFIQTHVPDDLDQSLYGHRPFKYFALFDGHGGSEAARFAESKLKDEILSQDGFWSDDDDDIAQSIREAFVYTHLRMKEARESWPRTPKGFANTSGTTASVVIIRNDKIFVAHVGDSCVVFGENSDTSDSTVEARCVTKVKHSHRFLEHKPDDAQELERIKTRGGDISFGYGASRVVWKRPRPFLINGVLCCPDNPEVFDDVPFLAMSRALGDFWSYNDRTGQYVVSPEPDVSVHNITQKRFIIIASDGVWNVMNCHEAANCVESALVKAKESSVGDDENPATVLVRTARTCWSSRGLNADNISAIVVVLQSPGASSRKPSSSSVLADDGSASKSESSTPTSSPQLKRRRV